MTRLTEKQCREKIEKYKAKCLKYECCTIPPELNLSGDEQHSLMAWIEDYNKYCREYQFYGYAYGVWQANEYIDNANICFDYMHETDYSMRGMTCALRNFGFDTVSGRRDDDGELHYEEVMRVVLDSNRNVVQYTYKSLEDLFDSLIDSLVDALDENQYVRI